MKEILLPVAIVLVVLNAAAMHAVLRSREFDRKQKTYQIVFIWLVPVLGATLCLSMAREPHPARPRRGDAGEEIGAEPARRDSAREGRMGDNAGADSGGD